MVAPTLLPSPGNVGQEQRFRGCVRSYCPFKGRGHLKLNGLQGTVQREIFFEQADVVGGEISVGAYVTFTMQRSNHGRPRASDIKVIVKGVEMRDTVKKLVGSDHDWNRTYVGTVKWFHLDTGVPNSLTRKNRGVGWLECEETFSIFQRDVWVTPTKLQGYQLGDRVKFKLGIDHYWSWPEAHHIELVDTKLEDGPMEDGPSQRLQPILPPEALEIICDTLPERLENSEPDAVTSAVNVGTNGCLTDQDAQQHEPTQISHNPMQDSWKRYSTPDGKGAWWWCEVDEEFFMEDNPGPWTKYSDPSTGREYWWKDDERWFWL